MEAQMFLTGYHGTTLAFGNKILKEKNFNISDGDKEWLGDGIYFYFSISDAYSWKNSEAIVHAVIKIADDEYLDIDSPEGMKTYNSMINIISSTQGKMISPNADVQQNQCAVMRMIWHQLPKIQVISASFPREKTKIKTLIDKRPRRREFCVRSNDYIKHLFLIRKGDLDD